MTKRPPRQSGTPEQDGLARLRAAHSAGAALFDQNRAKADLALALRSVRKSKGMTAVDIRHASAYLGRPLTASIVATLESPVAALPTLEHIVGYAAACGAQVELFFVFGENDGRGAFRVKLS